MECSFLYIVNDGLKDTYWYFHDDGEAFKWFLEYGFERCDETEADLPEYQRRELWDSLQDKGYASFPFDDDIQVWREEFSD